MEMIDLDKATRRLVSPDDPDYGHVRQSLAIATKQSAGDIAILDARGRLEREKPQTYRELKEDAERLVG